jgi:hydrogenase-4 transcriptional activator
MRDDPVLLASMWRSATSAGTAVEFLSELLPLLATRFPVVRITLWRLDRPTRTLLLGGSATTLLRKSPPPASITLDDEGLDRALAETNGERAELLAAGDRRLTVLEPLLRGATSPIALVPIASGSGGADRLLVVECGESATRGETARGTLDLLREPLAAAVANEQRDAELVSLRDAADRQRRSVRREYDVPVGSSGGEEIIGAERGLRGVIERVDMVSRADVPVLILGETGSGKEVIARAVHDRSSRSVRSFVRVNCGAIPPDLIDSELFGHDRGAFTGATDARKGWFERADGGTLFLDEVGELPLPAQVRLLRVLQDGTLQRVGGQRSLHVDVRIIAATHRDLPSLVQRREFREDLWYRIAVFPILLPPLRDHREDIPELAERFARRAARRFGLPAAPLAPSDLALLAAYAWPGNVRELASVIERAVIIGGGTRVAVASALGTVGPASSALSARDPSDGGSAAQGGAIESLDEAIRRHITRALQATRGVIEGPRGAAAILGINPHTLRSRMRKLRLRWADFRS